MTTPMQTQLNRFADWLRETDDHALYHLGVLVEVELASRSGESIRPEDRRCLASKLERWRYQHLNEHAGELDRRHQEFVDALDVVANRLAGYEPRSPRGTRHAIHDESLESGSIGQAVSLLQSRVPLRHLEEKAREMTGRQPAPNRPQSERPVLLYAPLYVSSHCVNHCTYCGFRFPMDIDRMQLTVDEVIEQARLLKQRGFRHLLIVGGDFPQLTTTAYYRELIESLVALEMTPAVEIAAQSVHSYAELVDAGICGVTLYQETYDERLYPQYHVRGPKSSFHWRLEALDRAAEGGVARLGLGILLGLSDARDDVRRMMRHAAYLSCRFPNCSIAFSLPRIHRAPQGFQVPHPVSDDELVRLYCILRIAFPDSNLVLSTREGVALRNRLAKICVTQMSAGSSTTPGGYEPNARGGDEQFPVSDGRSPQEVANWLRGAGVALSWDVD